MGNKNCTKSRKFYITLLVFYCIFYNSLVYANITNTITITAIVPHRVYNPLTSSNIPAGGFSGPVTLTGDSIIFKGIAHPKSVIKLTQDGVFTATVQTKED